MSRHRPGLVLAGVGAVAIAIGYAVAVGIVWSGLDAAGREGFVDVLDLVVAIGVGLTFLGGMIAGWFFRSFMLATRRMTEEVDLMATVNPAHRIDSHGPAHLRGLGRSINRLAERLWESLGEQETAVAVGRSAVEQEKERLSAIVSNLAQGVVVCNLDGQILLYNGEASRLLVSQDVDYIGLGRSVFVFLDRNVVLNALHRLQLQAERGTGLRPQRFIATIPSGYVLRMTMAAVRDAGGVFTGFVLTMEDATKERAARDRRDQLFRSITQDTRRSVAGIRAAIEMIRDYPAMSSEERGKFRSIIADEAERLSARVDEVSSDHTDTLESAWELDDMLADDLILAVANRIEAAAAIATSTDLQAESVWVKVDALALVDRLGAISERMTEQAAATGVVIGLQESGRFAVLDLSWPDSDVTELAISTSIREASHSGGNLESVIDRHGGEVWCEFGPDGKPFLRVLLPKSTAVPALAVRVLDEGRPEYHDFDLFEQRDPAGALDDRPLRDLVFTVFDTETTGLDPDGGDEIISVGAVRILNGRLLRFEAFDQLVDPRRSIPADSYAFHKISADMLVGQHTIDVVLPRFSRFVGDTVLVGHNVGFDLKFLRLKEEQTGVAFTNPVLDTLLLAAIVYPDAEVHSLEAMARLVGVPVTGRHTSLGDALVTAELFLRLIPLLEANGLETFGQVHKAEKETFYARLEY